MAEKKAGSTRAGAPAPSLAPPQTSPNAITQSLSQITSFMTTSFPSRNRKDDKSPSDVAALKEEFERKIAAIVFCLEEKAEENIDLSYKLKAAQETGRQREKEKDRVIEDLQKTIKGKEEEVAQLEKKASDDVTSELNRRIQTITHCLNDMAEENLRLRTTSAAKPVSPRVGSARMSFNPPPPHASSFSMMDHDSQPSSASFLSSLSNSSVIMTTARSPSTSTPSATSPSVASTQPSTQPSQPSTQPSPPANAASKAPPAATTLLPPTTITTATNTSPHPDHAPPPISSDVADLKSEILAEEFLKEPGWLNRFADTYLAHGATPQSVALLFDIIKQDKLRSENTVKSSLEVKIKELETTLKDNETNAGELKAKLAKETDRTGSLSDSVAEYEKKLKELEGRMWDNLNKEGQRRTEAETKAKRLKKKVDELQFLLDELKDEGSDEDDDDDSKSTGEGTTEGEKTE